MVDHLVPSDQLPSTGLTHVAGVWARATVHRAPAAIASARGRGYVLVMVSCLSDESGKACRHLKAAEFARDVIRVRSAKTIERVPGEALVAREVADDLHPTSVHFHHERESMSLEHRLDGAEMVFAHAAKDEVGVLRRFVDAITHQQLGDDFVRA